MRNLGLGIYFNKKKAGSVNSNISGQMPDALLYLASSPGTDNQFQIAFTDTGGLNTSYTVVVSVNNGGILTYDNVTGVTGSGTGTTSMSAQTELTIEGKTISVSGLTDTWATINWSISGDQDGSFISGSFQVHALPDLETSDIDETVLSGSDIFPSLTNALAGSSASVVQASTIYDRPMIFNVACTDNGNGTFDISLDLISTYLPGSNSGGSVYYVVTTDTTMVSNENGDEADLDNIIAGLDLSGSVPDAAGSQVFTGSATSQTITISNIPVVSNGDYSVLIAVQLTATDGTENIKGYVEEDTVTITGASVDALLQEDGFYLLQENGDRILL